MSRAEHGLLRRNGGATGRDEPPAARHLRELGQQMAARKEELQADPSQINAEPVSIDMDAGMGRAQPAGQRGRRDSKGEGSSFPDRSGRERDGEGRFMSERRGDDERRNHQAVLVEQTDCA